MQRILHNPEDELRRVREICDRQEALIENLRRELESRPPNPQVVETVVPPVESIENS